MLLRVFGVKYDGLMERLVEQSIRERKGQNMEWFAKGRCGMDVLCGGDNCVISLSTKYLFVDISVPSVVSVSHCR